MFNDRYVIHRDTMSNVQSTILHLPEYFQPIRHAYLSVPKNDIWKNFGDIIDTVKLPIKLIVDKGIHIRQRIRPSFTCDN